MQKEKKISRPRRVKENKGERPATPLPARPGERRGPPAARAAPPPIGCAARSFA